LTHGRQLGGRTTPRVFSKPAWYRFSRGRRARYVSRIIGTPSDSQAALVQTLIRLEWSALRAEDAGTLMGDREGREHRRLFQRLLDDFERGLAKPAAKVTPVAELDAHYARMVALAQDAASE
jgi:hypothetical protein